MCSWSTCCNYQCAYARRTSIWIIWLLLYFSNTPLLLVGKKLLTFPECVVVNHEVSKNRTWKYIWACGIFICSNYNFIDARPRRKAVKLEGYRACWPVWNGRRLLARVLAYIKLSRWHIMFRKFRSRSSGVGLIPSYIMFRENTTRANPDQKKFCWIGF
jgi:hypothetical protein